MAKPISLETRQRQSRVHLTRKQLKFCEEYAHLGNGTEAARRAGYSASSDDVLAHQATENLRKPLVKAELARIDAEMAVRITPQRVQQRLHDISHNAEAAGQFGPACRAEELLGKSIGMWIDQSLRVSGVLNDSHVTALIELARKRQAEPVDLTDEETDG